MWLSSAQPIWALAILTLLSTLTHAAHISFAIIPSQLLPQPSTLSASTRATLFKHSTTLSVPLTRSNTFEFRNLSSGSYLFTVQARDHTFGPLRVDVAERIPGETGHGQRVDAWQTFWGNEWANKGEYRGGNDGAAVREGEEVNAVISIVPERIKEFYEKRQGFDPISFLKSPMILMALVSLGLIVGMPYMTASMDDETREEFEKMSAKSPLSQATSAGRTGLENFDLASWMAGKTSGGGGEKKKD